MAPACWCSIPPCETNIGLPLNESPLILLWLEKKVPSPSLLDGSLETVISQAGRATGVIDAMANIVTGTMQMGPNLGESRVGLRRRRTIFTGLRPLETDPPAYAGGTPNVAVIPAVVAFNYLRLRFDDAPRVEPTPCLEAIAAAVSRTGLTSPERNRLTPAADPLIKSKKRRWRERHAGQFCREHENSATSSASQRRHDQIVPTSLRRSRFDKASQIVLAVMRAA